MGRTDKSEREDRLLVFREELRHQREALARYRGNQVTEADVRWVLNALRNLREEFPDIGPATVCLGTGGLASRRRYSPDILLRDVTVVLSRIHMEIPSAK